MLNKEKGPARLDEIVDKLRMQGVNFEINSHPDIFDGRKGIIYSPKTIKFEPAGQLNTLERFNSLLRKEGAVVFPIRESHTGEIKELRSYQRRGARSFATFTIVQK